VLCPSSTEAIINNMIEYWQCNIETTDQNFQTWNMSNEIRFNYNYRNNQFCQYYGIIQPTLFEISPGTILALMRSGCSVIAQSISYDYGQSFEMFASPSELPNPNAGIDGTVMQGEEDIGLLLVFNNSTDHRTPLSVAHSVDKGKSWNILSNLETDPQGSFAYPAVIQSRLNARTAHTCFTYNSGGNLTMAYIRLDFPSSTTNS